jgi:methionyl-tRNA formyltransferase
LVHAILNGESYFGVSLHYIDKNLDTGPVIDRMWCRVESSEDAVDLTLKLENLGVSLFEIHARRIVLGALPATPQQEIAERDGITPRFYTRGSLEGLNRVEPEWPWTRIVRTARAFAAERERRAYVEWEGQKVFLTTK